MKKSKIVFICSIICLISACISTVSVGVQYFFHNTDNTHIHYYTPIMCFCCFAALYTISKRTKLQEKEEKQTET